MLDTDSGAPIAHPYDCYVLAFEDIDLTHLPVVGGKGAHLAELSRIDGVLVPAGYCVTADAFHRVVADVPALDEPLDQLSLLSAQDPEAIRALSAEIRGVIEGIPIPHDVARAITGPLVRLGEGAAYAVRSSATAEDLPSASFAGQQDTYLNVGRSAIAEHVSRCWASLFTERAVTYRLQNGFDHRLVSMAVVVQQMVTPDSSGVLFTADPVTSNRKVSTVEASFGLGEALVSGRVNADAYRVRDGKIVDQTIATKQVATYAASEGGTQERSVDPELQAHPALSEAQVLRLAQLGRQIEAHFDRPQDIEWCLVDGEFHVVQARPVTTLFPIPATADDDNHVYLSVGHQQMMTDPMKPLGLSFWQLTTPRPMAEAGGRLFVDVTQLLASPSTRDGLLDSMAKSDPLMRDAMQTVLDRGFVPSVPTQEPDGPPPGGAPAPPIEADPAIVTELIARSKASLAAARRDIETKSGPELFDFILEDLHELRRVLHDPESYPAIMAGMEATWWLNEKLHAWLGETNAADVLTQSAPTNVTSQMGLALLDVADVIRRYPEVVDHLREVEGDGFLDGLAKLEGGGESRDAIASYLDTYGMRCVGEIDITRPRWSERPSTLVPLILYNIENFDAGASERRFEQGLRAARTAEQDLLVRVQALPEGEGKAAETKRMVDQLRTFIGYREYPKYGMISRYFIYKQALMKEAQRLVQDGALRDTEDIFYLTIQELHDVARTRQADETLIRQRKEAFEAYEHLTPPRVLTSEGEAVAGAYQREGVPTDALVGLPVCAGDVEGRARVILDMAEADLDAGDILVTAHTDPSWSPLFVTIRALVTEVGGSMTHGAVVAREYGLPAVVGVEHATRLIQDGQRIRVNGTSGYVEVLS